MGIRRHGDRNGLVLGPDHRRHRRPDPLHHRCHQTRVTATPRYRDYETPEQVLACRFALREIDDTEYRNRLEVLHSTRGADTAEGGGFREPRRFPPADHRSAPRARAAPNQLDTSAPSEIPGRRPDLQPEGIATMTESTPTTATLDPTDTTEPMGRPNTRLYPGVGLGGHRRRDLVHRRRGLLLRLLRRPRNRRVRMAPRRPEQPDGFGRAHMGAGLPDDAGRRNGPRMMSPGGMPGMGPGGMAPGSSRASTPPSSMPMPPAGQR